MPNKQKTYDLKRHGNLLWLNAEIGGMGAQLDEINTGVSAIADRKSLVVRLLVDTGASYTFIPLDTLNTLRYDTNKQLRRQAISTGNGQISVPIVRVAWLNCLGQAGITRF
ncbi:MAG: hypothetical protein Fur0025_04840 [Oscillatoriaceae cyanobacterium]